jgi:hypothetical protein
VSNNLNLAQIAATQLNKHVTSNDADGQLDAALTEQFLADVAAGNVALTAEQYRRAIHIKASGAATSGRTVTLQAIKKFSVISNFSLTHSVGFVLGATTITLGPAPAATEPAMAVVYTDGSANGLFSPGAEDKPFVIGMFIPGTHGNGALMAQVVFDRAVEFEADLPDSQGYAQVTATASTVLDLQKNGVNIGTITFPNAGNTATFSLPGGASFVAGDRLAVINDNPADATLADLSLTFNGTRT